MNEPTLTHVDEAGAPAMVDVHGKAVSWRLATAEACVVFPPAAAAALRAQGFSTAKGPVFHTAIIAGTQAAKQTHHLIPFCHALQLELAGALLASPAARGLPPGVTLDEESDDEVVVGVGCLRAVG